MPVRLLLNFFCLLLLFGFVSAAWGHNISAENAEFVLGLSGAAPGPFLYLGAKHMFTGYDHLLFLLGVIFFLYRPRDIILYVTLFTIGHSITLLLGVLSSWQVNGHLVDAIIGLSIVYKAFENIKGFETLLPWPLDTRIAVFVFGLCHGLGLATKLQEYVQSGDGLLVNLLSFNVGVELGQLCALAAILLALLGWRSRPSFQQQAFAVNTLLMCAGFV
ncbi:MAG: HupE/UreJ family protein, partial [Oceanicoccus sp.]